MPYTTDTTVLRDTICSDAPDLDASIKALLPGTRMAGGASLATNQLPEQERLQELEQAASTAYLGCHASIATDGGHPSFDPNTLGSSTKTPISAFLVPITNG